MHTPWRHLALVQSRTKVMSGTNPCLQQVASPSHRVLFSKSPRHHTLFSPASRLAVSTSPSFLSTSPSLLSTSLNILYTSPNTFSTSPSQGHHPTADIRFSREHHMADSRLPLQIPKQSTYSYNRLISTQHMPVSSSSHLAHADLTRHWQEPDSVRNRTR